jgi:hypothetical protein
VLVGVRGLDPFAALVEQGRELEAQRRVRRMARERGFERRAGLVGGAQGTLQLGLQSRIGRLLRRERGAARRGVERLEHAVLRRERERQVVPAAGQRAIGRDCLARRGLALRVHAERDLAGGEVRPDLRRLGRVRDRLAQGVHRRFGTADRLEHEREVGPRLRLGRLDGERRADAVRGLRVLARLEQHDARVVQRTGMPRLGLENGVVAKERLPQLSLLVQAKRPVEFLADAHRGGEGAGRSGAGAGPPL